MAGRVKHEPRGEVGEFFSRFDRMFEEWARMLPLPEGTAEADITATYKAGTLEIRIPEPKQELAKKIAITKS
jgi:HSP20 family molecular chaperone IbpA